MRADPGDGEDTTMRARLHFGFAVLSLLQLGSSPASASQENSTPESGDDSSLIRLGDLQQTQFASDIDSQSEVVPLFSSHGETTKYEPFAARTIAGSGKSRSSTGLVYVH